MCTDRYQLVQPSVDVAASSSPNDSKIAQCPLREPRRETAYAPSNLPFRASDFVLVATSLVYGVYVAGARRGEGLMVDMDGRNGDAASRSTFDNQVPRGIDDETTDVGTRCARMHIPKMLHLKVKMASEMTCTGRRSDHPP